ncbi:MAG: hypothetical protein HYV29_04340 [Ignavibacteriales bacterium]|nr:hypothetical protein [Ignavibacteriales bacterium]
MKSSTSENNPAGVLKPWQVFIRTILPILFLLLFTGASYEFTFQNGWTSWDDDVYVTDNPYIRNFSPENVTAVWTKQFNGSYLPLTMMSYMLDYSIAEFDPFVYHLTNVLFHLANTVLVYLFIGFLTKGNYFAAFTTAMIFGIHPMHVESVAWISARKDVLSGFFFLLSLIAYLKYVQEAKQQGLIFSFLFFVLALFSKVIVFTLPAILLLIDRYHGRAWHKSLFMEKIPFVFAGLVFALIGLLSQHTAEAIRSTSIEQFILMPHYSLYFYLEKFILPINLSSLYPYPKMKDGFFPLIVYGAVPVVYSVGYVAWKKRREKDLMFGLLFFLVLILPVLQHIRFSNIIAADRFTYLSYIGLSFPIGMWLNTLYARSKRQRRRAILAIGVIIITVLYLTSMERVKVWKDSRTLWNDVFKKYPDAFQ